MFRKLGPIAAITALIGALLASFSSSPANAVAGDVVGPEIIINSPVDPGIFRIGVEVVVDFSCQDESGVATCEGSIPLGGTLNTATLGIRTFTVTATDSLGNVSVRNHPLPRVHRYLDL